MVPTPYGQERWFRQRGDECALQVVGIVDALKLADGTDRRNRYFAALSRYEARSLSNESMRTDGGAMTAFEDELYNVSRSAVDTAQAEIAARQRPKPMFLTTGADWRTKRKAKKLDKFVEAQLHQRQGARYADAWQLTEDVFKDAEIAVGGVLKVSVNVAQERIDLERVPCYEINVDPLEAAKGNPQNWYHDYDMDLDAAIEKFAGEDSKLSESERHQMEVMLQASADLSRASSSDISMVRSMPVVHIYEAWRLPFSAKKPGRHVFACKVGMLLEEDWTWPMPPLLITVWQSEAFGIWGTGLVEEGAAQHDKVNEMSNDLHERLRLCASKYIFYQSGTVDLDAMKSNETVVFVPVTGQGMVPQERMAPPVTPAEAELLEKEISRYYDLRGISQVSANQKHEAGVDSAVAQQTLNDIKSVRFLPKARAYELLFVPLGDLIVRATRDLAVSRPGLIAKWPGKRFLESIQWSDVNMDESLYECRVAPVSAMSRDPAQRLQIVEQLVGMGFLPKEKYFELLGMPDLDSVLEGEGAETQWVDKLIDRYLDAEDDAELKKLGGFTEPDGYLLNPIGALVTVAQHYFAAMVDDVPNYNAALLRRFMNSLQRQIKVPAPAAPAAMPGAAAVPGAPGIVPPVGAPAGLGVAA